MKLPAPQHDGKVSVEKAIKTRRTIRSFASKQLSLEQLAQLLWSAQGVTSDKGYLRSVPSAGALYPLDLYAAVGTDGVEGINSGVYHYQPTGHSVDLLLETNPLPGLAKASLSQMWMAKAQISLVITVEYDRITGKYGRRGAAYALMEAGHTAQNIFLQAEALGLGCGIVGAFHDQEVIHTMKLPQNHEPVVILPVGVKS